ncbi:hypothetical protein SAMN05421595_1957 [Austwickia chelonae]|uniref:GH26 domain-containing protein n=1 Tax=Austwickia chelonae NBRC 105200 TaxID=1184607 RepID=K6W4S9_9MICO|nr:hypothetical protein [Austwickia chelonae]GAB76822.1 hypothetical protein AUCHE_03_00390 [Austwickia chelonae NBRC 105200]SEW31154.1 hypothetical protein SAMN05421595_1957 [Austwickia chelonae]
MFPRPPRCRSAVVITALAALLLSSTLPSAATAAEPAAPQPSAAAKTATERTELVLRFLLHSTEVRWTEDRSPAAGWLVSVTTGHSTHTQVVPGARRSHFFTDVVVGQRYTFVVTNQDTGATRSASAVFPRPGIFTPSPPTTEPLPPVGNATSRLLGPSRSGKPWFSGAWVAGGTWGPQRAEEWGTFRGSPNDATVSYSHKESFARIAESDWNVSVFNGFPGKLVYGLSLLPQDGTGSLSTVARGDHDHIWRAQARVLLAHGRGDAVVRIGWEANGDWWPWQATVSTAPAYRAAFARVSRTLKSVAPKLLVDFGIGCGAGIPGQRSRLDALTVLYPGDDVVDLVGCDTYDWWNTRSTDEASFARTIRPAQAPGIADVADFARAHRKGMSVPEWGTADVSRQGAGDNPFYIRKMYEWFMANSDVLVLECFFNEPGPGVSNSLWSPVQMPRASAEYARLF